MTNELFVRVYNVGLGNCVYIRIIDSDGDAHILIDCGNKFGSSDILRKCLGLIKGELPEVNGKACLDLLVVTHPHEDHQKGFDAASFKDIQIKNIWLSPAFNVNNPNARGFFALQDAAVRAARGIAKLGLEGWEGGILDIYGVSNDVALEVLNETLPDMNGIDPVYVSASTDEEKLSVFENPNIKIKVLAPEGDIDHYYIGGKGLMFSGIGRTSNFLKNEFDRLYQDPEKVNVPSPVNISAQDFHILRNSVLVNAMATARVASEAANNLSVVLMIEWRRRRLLFTGDAEWSESYNGEVKIGSDNGSWNVMWNRHREDLSEPVDYYLIGHHGSGNATPWKAFDENEPRHPINDILDALLPEPEVRETAKAYAVASTQRTKRWPTIPNAKLMEELGKRVANSRTDYDETGENCVRTEIPQPQRTDLEKQHEGREITYIETRFEA